MVCRILDRLLSLIAIIVLSPLLAVIAIGILISDGWPVFFVQPRVGKDGAIFNLLKFRSMRVGPMTEPSAAEQVNAFSIKLRDDPRILPFGGFLRRNSLDELPQLFNILAGQMSIVGPRPWVPKEYQIFPAELGADRRLAVRPGLTGEAQINGRSDLPLDQIIDLDCRWIADQSLSGYLRIICTTAMKLFGRRRKEDGGVY